MYNVTVTDLHLASSTRTVMVTVTGTNDTPTITAAQGDVPAPTQSGGVTEDVVVDFGGQVSTAGTITFQDVDLIHTHTATFVLKSTDATGQPTGLCGRFGTPTPPTSAPSR